MKISPRTYIKRIAELEKVGYVYCERTCWWWCAEDKYAVDDLTVHVADDDFLDLHLNCVTICDYEMYSYKRINPDILETIYRKHFPKQGFLNDEHWNTRPKI